MNTASSRTKRSWPSTSSMPICCARKACSKYALLWAPAGNRTTVGSATPVGATLRRLSSSTSGEWWAVATRRHALPGEEFGKQAHHHFPVLEHVRDPGGDAQIVLEYAELAGIVAHDVDACDVRVDAPGHVDALHLRAVLRVAENLFSGNDARVENLLVVVYVVNEGVKRTHPLLQAGLEPNPFFQRHDARHDIERDQAFRTFFLAVDSKGNADAV